MTLVSPRVIALVLLCSVVPAACSSDKKTTPPTTSGSTAPSTLSTSTSTPAQIARTAVVWPTANSDVRYRSPVSVARSFAVEYLHFVKPVVGAFRQGDSNSGEVPVRTTGEGSSSGPETTVLVRKIDGSWWVLGAGTPNLRLTEPAALAQISSPVRLRGTSTAFEGTVNVSIRQDDVTEPLVEGTMNGGSNGQMGPFDASFTFAAPTSNAGAIVLSTISSATGNVAEASVTRVRFSSP